jgi:hypothetical protein
MEGAESNWAPGVVARTGGDHGGIGDVDEGLEQVPSHDALVQRPS